MYFTTITIVKISSIVTPVVKHTLECYYLSFSPVWWESGVDVDTSECTATTSSSLSEFTAYNHIVKSDSTPVQWWQDMLLWVCMIKKQQLWSVFKN